MKKRFIAEGGVEVTDQMLDKWAEPWENGVVPGRAAGFVASPGRPALSNEKTQTVTVRLPVSIIRALDHKAKQQGETRSQRVREAIMDDLLKTG